MNAEQTQPGSDHSKTVLAAAHFLCRSLAATVEVFLHKSRSMGERYLGLQAGAAVLCIFFFTAFWRGQNVVPVFGFLIAYVSALAIARLGVLARVRSGGQQVHTLYTGAPRIMRITGSLSEETVKRIVEPMLIFVIGALTLAANQPLGAYLMLASFGLFASVNLSAGFDRTRALDLNDAFLDQSNVAERFREMRGQ